VDEGWRTNFMEVPDVKMYFVREKKGRKQLWGIILQVGVHLLPYSNNLSI
jgi:hypothetical protein